MIKQVVILAGGQGNRMRSIDPFIPKALNLVGGRPIIEHTLELVAKNDITKVHLLLGHLASQILENIEQYKEDYGLTIDFSIERKPLGTGGAILKINERLDNQFILIYGDLFVQTSLLELRNSLNSEDVDFVQMVHPSSHMQDSDLVVLNENNLILDYSLKPRAVDHLVSNVANAGIYAFRRETFMKFDTFKNKIDLDRELLPQMIKQGAKGKVIRNFGYIKDAGTPERLVQINIDFKKPYFAREVRPAIFLDRDGTINRSNGYIARTEQLEIYSDVTKFVADANRSGYWVIVVTNQPIVARGEAKLEDIKRLHAKIDAHLALEGAYIDAYYLCPHHPDSGFAGEVKALKFDCSCRKPQAGLILKAMQDFKIDILNSVLIGDSEADRLAAEMANIRFIRIARREETVKEVGDSLLIIKQLGEFVLPFIN